MKTSLMQNLRRGGAAGAKKNGVEASSHRGVSRLSLNALLAAMVAAVLLAAPAMAMPERGSEAPEFTLTSLGGEQVSLERFKGRAVVLLFGELGHERTNLAAADLRKAIDDRRLVKEEAVAIMIVAHDRAPEELPREARGAALPELILHDPKREAFGAYRILVIPSVVVIGTDGRVVYAAPGFVPRFRQLLGEALLVATGLESPEAFQRSVDPPDEAERDPAETRAERLLHLGEQLLQRGMTDMAEARFREAVHAAPGMLSAHLALGRMLLEQNKLDEAEAQFNAAQASHPDSIEATLGAAEVMLRRGDDRADEAEAILRDALDAAPSSARAHYLLGALHQRRGEHEQAAEAFRRAAELLLRDKR